MAQPTSRVSTPATANPTATSVVSTSAQASASNSASTSTSISTSSNPTASDIIATVYAQVTFPPNGGLAYTVEAVQTNPGSVIGVASPTVIFTVERSASYVPGTSLVLDLRATVTATTTLVNALANIVFYTPTLVGVDTQYPGSTIANLPLATTPPAGASPSSNPTEVPTTVFGTSTSGTIAPTTRPTTDNTPYGAGALAGAAVGCAIGGILLTALIFFLLFRKRLSRKQQPSRSPENGQPLLRGHGEAVYVAGAAGTGWEKQLPQADADSTIRSMSNRTLDQIAMHVENYYTSKGNVALGTEHEFELETIDSSPISDPISTVLRRHDRVEELIKHYMSGYIISMIDFEGSGRSGNFLPKAFRKQWQPASEDTPAFSQAYSRWRVVTAYLRQTSDDERAYIAERDSIIATAARHVCKAFEPWAKADERTRLQNIIGIMTRASELGVQLFSQPARFEWQWLANTGDRSGSSLVVLPGLYKMTDQQSVTLTQPLHLVEPQVVRF